MSDLAYECAVQCPMIDLSELVQDWVDDILHPDIDWSTYHEQLGEYVDNWDELDDDQRDILATRLDLQIEALLEVARIALKDAPQ